MNASENSVSASVHNIAVGVVTHNIAAKVASAR